MFVFSSKQPLAVASLESSSNACSSAPVKACAMSFLLSAQQCLVSAHTLCHDLRLLSVWLPGACAQENGAATGNGVAAEPSGVEYGQSKFAFTMQQLVVFKCYAVAQSLDEAAAALGMTRSNVLMTLAILEREFDAELVEQARRSPPASAAVPWTRTALRCMHVHSVACTRTTSFEVGGSSG